MTTNDCRMLHLYRVPIYQKRTHVLNNSLPSPHTCSPSPSRRHSTPPVATKYLVDVHSSPSSTFVKYYPSSLRATPMNKEQNLLAKESNTLSSPKAMSLVKRRQQDERLIRVVTTPTSIKSFTDIVLPIAKKNRNTIVETTSSSNPSDIQSSNRNLRRPMKIVNLESEICISDEDLDEPSLQDNVSIKIERYDIFLFSL